MGKDVIMINPESIAEANYKNKLKLWHWEGEPGFIQLVEENQSPGMVVVEVGCYDGSTTRKYIETVKKNNGHVILIDTFMGSKSIAHDQDHGFGNHNIGLYKLVKDKFEMYSDMITIMKGYSHDCLEKLDDNSCDIIFIDADHMYDSCKKDIESSLPKIKKGGILSGHDCESFAQVNNFPPEAFNYEFWCGVHPGVIQAVYDTIGITDIKGACVWYTTIK